MADRNRAPREWPHRLVAGIQSGGRGSLGGRVDFAEPVLGEESDVDASISGGSTASAALGSEEDHYDEQFELDADGAQDIDLTYVPTLYSAHVYLNTLAQLEGVDYEIDNNVLSILTPMGALEDDVLDVRYSYLTGAPVIPTDNDDDDPWVAVVTNGTESAPASTSWNPSDFPDNTANWIWDRATTTGGSCPVGDVYFRKHLVGPEGTARLYGLADDNALVYLNGVQVLTSHGFAGAATDTADVTLTGDDWIAIKGTNGGVSEASVMLAVYRLVAGSPTDLLLHTDSSWECIGYPGAVPDSFPGPWA